MFITLKTCTNKDYTHLTGSFGARGIPKVFRVIEAMGIDGARFSGLCSLNDFRRFLNLAPYKSFEDMNPDIADDLKSLYGDIDNVELYPGLMTEKTKPTKLGSAFGLPFTVSRALLADAINVVRNDRFLTDEFNPHNLTSYFFNDLQSNPHDLATGGIIHKLILRDIPGIYKDNSALALYPFTTPEQTLKNLKGRNDGLWEKINFEIPK
jgi:linoleate 10R-lipoxygenase